MARSRYEIAQQIFALGPLTEQQVTLLFELAAEETAPKAKALPVDWQPSPAHYDWARTHGKDRTWVDNVAEDMRNWASAKGVLRSSWPGTFSTFMKRELSRPPTLRVAYAAPKRMLGGGYA